jgi:hypothetical protein
VEPLAQEIDHPSRRDSFPRQAGEVHLRHLPAVVLVMLAATGVGVAAAVAVGPSATALRLALACWVPAALGAVAAGTVGVLGGVPIHTPAWQVVPPEVAGMRLVFRTVWPPALATIGLLPVLAARVGGAEALSVGFTVTMLFALVGGWVRVREALHAWWQVQAEKMAPSS